MLRTASYIAGFALIVAAGAVDGLWSDRWALSETLKERVAALDRVPMDVGEWEGRPETLDARVLARGEIAGHLMRRYRNRRTGTLVNALLVCGRPGPIAVHSPEICYAGTGYEPTGSRSSLLLHEGAAAAGDSFWVINFVKEGPALSEYLRILYAWSEGERWEASKNPRWQFADKPALYKLYIVRQPAKPNEPIDGDPAVEFARAFVPAIKKSLLTRN